MGSSECFQGCVEGFDGGESFGGIFEDFGATWIGGADGWQGSDGEVLIERQHLCGTFPCSIEQQQSGLRIAVGEQWSSDTESHVGGQVNGHGFGERDEQIFRVFPERFYGTFAASFAGVNDDDGAWRDWICFGVVLRSN